MTIDDLLEDWHELMNDKAWRRLVVTVEDAIDEALERGYREGLDDGAAETGR